MVYKLTSRQREYFNNDCEASDVVLNNHVNEI